MFQSTFRATVRQLRSCAQRKPKARTASAATLGVVALAFVFVSPVRATPPSAKSARTLTTIQSDNLSWGDIALTQDDLFWADMLLWEDDTPGPDNLSWGDDPTHPGNSGGGDGPVPSRRNLSWGD